MAVDPRKRTAAAQPSPWYVHPFEAHDRGATHLLVYYTRSLNDSQRGELFADVLHRLYGDYYRHAPKREGESMVWYCPAMDQRGADIEGTLNADNAVEWVEVDALHSMLVYLASGDFFRLCNDFARELELNTAMMSAEEAREELHRASNVLTAYYDIQVDVEAGRVRSPQGSRPPPRQLDVLSARRSGLTAARDFAPRLGTPIAAGGAPLRRPRTRHHAFITARTRAPAHARRIAHTVRPRTRRRAATAAPMTSPAPGARDLDAPSPTT